MASWLVGRLVSGLGVATTAAAHPLARHSCDAASGSLARLASSAWGRWPDPCKSGVQWALPGAAAALSSSSSSLPAAAPAASRAAAPADLPPSASGRARAGATLPAFLRASRSPAGAAVAVRVAPVFSAPVACHSRSDGGCNTSSTVFYSSSAASAATSEPATASRASAAEAGAGSSATSNDAAAAALSDPKPDLVDKFLSLDVANSSARRRAERQEVLKDFQRHPADTGTPPVMVALWTHRVRSLVRVFDAGRKQLPSIRQLEMLVNRRRRMLTWLRRTDFESYSYTISKLGLRDIYVPAGGEHRYREGVRPSDPVDDDIKRIRFNFHTKYRQGKTSLWKRLRPKLVAEDPALQSADAEAAVEDRQRRQQRREVAAQQRMAVEREREGEQGHGARDRRQQQQRM